MKGAVKNAINCKLISRIKGAPRKSLVAHPSTISFLFFLLNSYETRPRRLSKCRKNCCRPLLTRWTVYFLCLLQTSLLSQRTVGLPTRQNAHTNVLGHFSERWKDQDLPFYSWNWKGVSSSYETKFTHLYFSFGFNEILTNLTLTLGELISNLESLSINSFLYETKKTEP